MRDFKAMTASATAWTIALLLLTPAACAQAPGDGRSPDGPATDSAAAAADVEAVLDAFHAAASEADGDAYFGLFAEEGVFLGTDATERWSVAEFRAYAKPHFDRGQGWTYTPLERHVYLSDDGTTAWFDERLHNDGLGETRGSGALVLRDGEWKVAQYNLTIPVPNALADDLVERIRALEAAEAARRSDTGAPD